MNDFLNLIFYPKIVILGIPEMIPEVINFNPEWVAGLSQNLQVHYFSIKKEIID